MKKSLRIFCYVVGSGMVAVALIISIIYGLNNKCLGDLQSEDNTPENASKIEKLEKEQRIYFIVIIALACSGILLIFTAFCSTFFPKRRERRRIGQQPRWGWFRQQPRRGGIRRQPCIRRPPIFHIELEEDAVAQRPSNLPRAARIELEEDAIAQRPSNLPRPRPRRVQRRRHAVDGREENEENVPAAPEPDIDQQAPNAEGTVADYLPRAD